jgi:aspartate/tyrosine/aromatic aminotransferase
MASGYRHLTLPVLDSIRESLGLPLIENIAMGTNSYEAYPAAFDQKKIRRYRYMTENGEFDFESFKKAAEILDPQKTIFLFDMSTGNNFAGVKRTQKDNENIAGILIDKKLYSEHDIAYPNFDPAFDPQWELHRILQKKGAPHGVQSSRGTKDKYASRLAFHHIYLGTPEQKSEIFSHLVSENRDRFLAMPDTWTYLVEIARDPVLKKAHDADNRAFVDIVNASRTSLADALGWDWMKSRSGMFDMVRISHEGIEIMARDFAVYAVPTRDQNLLGPDGEPVGVTRIKHGMPKSKIPKVAEALRRAAQKYPSDKGGVNPEIIVQRT